MSEFNSCSQLRRIKMLGGLNIDSSGSSSAYILESKIKKAVEAAYQRDAFLGSRFSERLDKVNLTKLSVIKRLEKMEAWQLKLVKQALDEQGVLEAIVSIFTIRKTDRRKYEPHEIYGIDN